MVTKRSERVNSRRFAITATINAVHLSKEVRKWEGVRVNIGKRTREDKEERQVKITEGKSRRRTGRCGREHESVKEEAVAGKEEKVV